MDFLNALVAELWKTFRDRILPSFPLATATTIPSVGQNPPGTPAFKMAVRLNSSGVGLFGAEFELAITACESESL